MSLGRQVTAFQSALRASETNRVTAASELQDRGIFIQKRKGLSVTCRELADFIIDYVDGGLETEVRAKFERHLTLCPNCVRYLAAYKTTIELGRRALLTDPDVPAAEAGAPEALINAILASRSRQ
jgi:anti-sigma factor RsiW